jgi:glycerol-3-phosphate dehydrogenase (NAD(P)+)
MDEVGAVVEGYYAAAAGVELSKRYKVEMPITEAAYRVLYNGAPIDTVFADLMKRSRKREIEESWLR